MIALFLNNLVEDQYDNYTGVIVIALLPEADYRLGRQV
jgi:hypothetical protein